MSPIIAYVKEYDIENQINTFQSIHFRFQAAENGWDLTDFRAFQEKLSLKTKEI